jgi:hypothetical protein
MIVRLRAAFLAWLLLTALDSCGGTTLPPSDQDGSAIPDGSAEASAPPSDTCAVSADCTWGEIPKEIVSASDCACLYGCGYLPQTKTTATRRLQQHTALCDPQRDGKGSPCGVDDCAIGGPLACLGGVCQVAPRDAGLGD